MITKDSTKDEKNKINVKNLIFKSLGSNDKISDKKDNTDLNSRGNENKINNNDQEIKIRINVNSNKDFKSSRNNDQNNPISQNNAANFTQTVNNKTYSKKVDDVYMEAIVQKDEKIFDLHKQYQELKKDRIKSEYDLKYLSNKLNLLEHEDKKKEIKVKRLGFNNSKILKNKSIITENKLQIKSLSKLKQTNLDNIKQKVNYIRQTEEYTLKNWRSEVIIKKHDEKQLLKKESCKLKKKKEKNEKSTMLIKKSIIEKVNFLRNCTRKNKLLKDDNIRELKIMELKEKILKENELRNSINKKIEEVEAKENQFIKSKTIQSKDFDKYNRIKPFSVGII